MVVKRISPEEAKELMDKEGYAYVDVRSIPEFEAGHPQGSFNVPLFHMGPGGMAPNPDFVAVMEKNFPKDAKLVVGCKAGGRSERAAALLESRGYSSLALQRAGFDGAPDPMTGRMEPGWRPKGLPVETGATPDRAYEGLAAKAK